MVSRRLTRSRQSDDQVPDLEPDNANIDAEENDEDEDEVEEITRCICGEPELQLSPNNPDFDDVDPGFFIQCEDCQVWQHGYCVGIKDEVDAPDKYWCELCKPELHTLVYKGPKDKRSLYTPVMDKKKKSLKKVKDEKDEVKKTVVKPVPSPTGSSPPSAHASTATATGSAASSSSAAAAAYSAPPKQSSSPETRHRRERSRGTLNSRDAEYEMMLKKALEESAKESGVQPEDPELSEYTRERTSRRRTRHDDAVKREDADEYDQDSGNRDRNEDQSDSFEKQDTKRRRVDHTSDQSDTMDVTNGSAHNLEPQAEDQKNIETSLTDAPELAAAAAAAINTANEASENDSSSVSKSISSAKKKRPRRAVNTKPKNETVNTVSPKKGRSKEEIDADKPTKPRLPQQRISLYEMRKRTTAILEFLVRTQSELKEDFETGVDITEFIDETASASASLADVVSKDEIKMSLKSGYDESMGLMENLTRKIIEWNTKYGENN